MRLYVPEKTHKSIAWYDNSRRAKTCRNWTLKNVAGTQKCPRPEIMRSKNFRVRNRIFFGIWMINKFLHSLYVSSQLLLRISMHDFYKFYVCPFMAVLLCEPGKECFKCNPAMRHYGSKFDKWSVTTCHPNRINHEKSSVCQYGTFQLYFSTFISAFII